MLISKSSLPLETSNISLLFREKNHPFCVDLAAVSPTKFPPNPIPNLDRGHQDQERFHHHEALKGGDFSQGSHHRDHRSQGFKVGAIVGSLLASEPSGLDRKIPGQNHGFGILEINGKVLQENSRKFIIRNLLAEPLKIL